VVVIHLVTAAAVAPHARQAARVLVRDGGAPSAEFTADLAALAAAERIVQVRRARLVDGPAAVLAGPVDGAARSVELLSSAQVAALAGVSRQAVHKAWRRGRLAGRLTAGRLRFSEQAAAAWVAGRGERMRVEDMPTKIPAGTGAGRDPSAVPPRPAPVVSVRNGCPLGRCGR
jgi:hypothetical protein